MEKSQEPNQENVAVLGANQGAEIKRHHHVPAICVQRSKSLADAAAALGKWFAPSSSAYGAEFGVGQHLCLEFQTTTTTMMISSRDGL